MRGRAKAAVAQQEPGQRRGRGAVHLARRGQGQAVTRGKPRHHVAACTLHRQPHPRLRRPGRHMRPDIVARPLQPAFHLAVVKEAGVPDAPLPVGGIQPVHRRPDKGHRIQQIQPRGARQRRGLPRMGDPALAGKDRHMAARAFGADGAAHRRPVGARIVLPRDIGPADIAMHRVAHHRREPPARDRHQPRLTLPPRQVDMPRAVRPPQDRRGAQRPLQRRAAAFRCPDVQDRPHRGRAGLRHHPMSSSRSLTAPLLPRNAALRHCRPRALGRLRRLL